MKRDKSDPIDLLFQDAVSEAAKQSKPALLAEAQRGRYVSIPKLPTNLKKDGPSLIRHRPSFLFFQRFFKVYSKAASLVVLLIILLTILVPNVSAARNWVTNIVMTSNPDYVTFYFQKENLNQIQKVASQPLLLNDLHQLPFLPDGMRLLSLHYRGDNYSFEYGSSSGDMINIEILGSDTAINMDNGEMAEISTEIVNDVEIRVNQRNDLTTLVWAKEDRLFILTTNLSKAEAIRFCSGIIDLGR